MIDITKLTEEDIGRVVLYRGYGDNNEVGRLKSFTEDSIFVVFKCAGLWNDYQNYTGQNTKPEDLSFIGARYELRFQSKEEYDSIQEVKRIIEAIGEWQDAHKAHHHSFYVSMIKGDLKSIIK